MEFLVVRMYPHLESYEDRETLEKIYAFLNLIMREILHLEDNLYLNSWANYSVGTQYTKVEDFPVDVLTWINPAPRYELPIPTSDRSTSVMLRDTIVSTFENEDDENYARYFSLDFSASTTELPMPTRPKNS